MNLKNAEVITQHVINRVGKFCELISPAGSVRRQCKEINNIDFVLVPRVHQIIDPDLFGTPVTKSIISPNFTTAIKSLSTLTKVTPDGKQIQSVIWNAKVEFFVVNPFDFYRMLCIRTGSPGYIWHVIGPAWRGLGWCGTEYGLRRIDDCRVIVDAGGKRRFELLNKSGDIPPAWQSEEHFFDWLQVPYVQPQDRDSY